MPRTMVNPLARLECHQVQIKVTPEPSVSQEHLDYFGNRVFSFAIESLHRELTVIVTSDVTVHSIARVDQFTAPAWETVAKQIGSGSDPDWLSAHEFLFDSPRIDRHSRYADYTTESFASDVSIIDATSDLTRRIHADFKYDPTATDVYTTTEEAFRLRAGVCQDFAHIQIACLRSIGLPARYVSGYLRTEPQKGKERLVGADESHAWVSVYAGDELGWVDFDPTNNCMANTNHIPVCIGRDFSEVSPMRGVVVGGGNTSLKVSVDVNPV